MRNAGIIFVLIIVCIGVFGCNESRLASKELEFQTEKTIHINKFEIKEINPGEAAWGTNCLKLRVKNTDATQRYLKIHIGGHLLNGAGFGMGELYTFEANEERSIKHWYWIPVGHGSFDMRVSFKEQSNIDSPRKEKAFFVKTFPVTFQMPNNKCNNLLITERLPNFKKYYPDTVPLEPFEYFETEHFVFYCSPATPAFKDITVIISTHESALMKICDFASISSPNEKIAFFLYPDQTTKKMCTTHTGDGLARGNMIAEVYNEQVKLDPNHELTHIVMGQIGNPPALFNEGLATSMQAGYIWNEHHVDETSAKLLKAGKLPEIRQLLLRTEIGSKENDGEIAYPVSASFVKYLIDNHGKDRFLKVYAGVKNGNNPKILKANLLRLKEAYGISIDELEKRWHGFLEISVK